MWGWDVSLDSSHQYHFTCREVRLPKLTNHEPSASGLSANIRNFFQTCQFFDLCLVVKEPQVWDGGTNVAMFDEESLKMAQKSRKTWCCIVYLLAFYDANVEVKKMNGHIYGHLLHVVRIHFHLF